MSIFTSIVKIRKQMMLLAIIVAHFTVLRLQEGHLVIHNVHLI